MGKRLHITYDSNMIEAISATFRLRAPNKEALRKLIFTLEGEYEPEVMQVMNLATGVGKTYLMAAFIEYLRRQGVGNVVIVTPGKVVQSKTVQNFTFGCKKYIEGARVPPDVVTPQDYSMWVARLNGAAQLSYAREVPMLAFVFNIQQLIAPKDMEGATQGNTKEAQRRKPRRFDESAGVLFDYLKGLQDLVVIADESHLYSSSAAAFNAALRELEPAATVGLTASALPEDHVVYRYPLYQAIKDKYVKTPVLAFRKGGYGDDRASEEQQLRDALQLRNIKQAYYDAYTKQSGLQRLNAVVFVVCADVDHATQMAGLLRSPEYLGEAAAVLQVDSKHEDEATQRLLENLDHSDSPVRAVVSVNKLKEGWDVKNIAVVVTLRAMASEVLTQQTMGRGLRLPFGKYTGVWQIDQLDIIAHQSFQELLSAENALVQFGLEDAVSRVDGDKVSRAIIDAALRGESSAEDMSQEAEDKANDSNVHREGKATVSTIGGCPCGTIGEHGVEVDGENKGKGVDEASPTFGAWQIGEGGVPEQDTLALEPVAVERNPRFAKVSYMFPVTMVNLVQPPIDLSEISDKAIEEAAKRVTSTGDVLYRKEIVAALGRKLRAVDAESAEVDSIHIDDDEAAITLVRLVFNMQLVPSRSETLAYVKRYLVPKFMKNVTFQGWTVKSLASAREQLRIIVRDYIEAIGRATKEIPDIYPTKISPSSYMLALGEKIYEPIDTRAEFVRGRVYSGWFKSLFEAESFDSYSGEYELARLLNTSPHVVWWHRLHPSYKAFIYYNAREKYYPDFVVRDDSDVYWIVEAKDKRGRDDVKVQAKRKAAEALVRRLVTIDEYAGQKWGYMIAYEDDIAKADTWDDLKVIARPVSNEV